MIALAFGTLAGVGGGALAGAAVYFVARWWLTRRHSRQSAHNWCDLTARWWDDPMFDVGRDLTADELNRLIRGPVRP